MISRNRGFGLVEIMVGLAIGLLTMLVIMQFSSVFENQKRATTTGGDAQTNGALALYAMEREVRAGGGGMTEGEPQKYPPLAGCTTSIYDAAPYLIPNVDPAVDSTVAAAGAASSIRLAPVVASDGGGGLSDSLTITYGTAMITAPYTLLGSYAPGAGLISLISAAGIAPGDMVALVDENTAATTGPNYKAALPCSLLRVTGLPGAGVLSVPVADTNGLAFTDNARLYNLGQFNLVTYRVDGNNLVADITKLGVIPDGGAGTAIVNRTDFSPLASNIVNMQVQYGVDTGNPLGPIQADCKTAAPGAALTAVDADAIVDQWVEPMGATWANTAATPSQFDLRRIRAIRIGLVVRSGVQEVPKPTDCERFPGAGCVNPFFPACSTTTTAPAITWDALPNMAPDLSTDPNWRCYRYKVFQATIPVRNALWSSTMNPASSASCGLRDPG